MLHLSSFVDALSRRSKPNCDVLGLRGFRVDDLGTSGNSCTVRIEKLWRFATVAKTSVVEIVVNQ